MVVARIVLVEAAGRTVPARAVARTGSAVVRVVGRTGQVVVVDRNLAVVRIDPARVVVRIDPARTVVHTGRAVAVDRTATVLVDQADQVEVGHQGVRHTVAGRAVAIALLGPRNTQRLLLRHLHLHTDPDPVTGREVDRMTVEVADRMMASPRMIVGQGRRSRPFHRV